MPIYPVRALPGLLGSFDLQGFLITLLVLCISLSFHEMAHAFAAHRLGDDTAAQQGRLTMNPLAHLDPIGAIAFLIGGIGWAKPVPINPSRFKDSVSVKKGLMLTSLAGPLANLLLAVVSVIFMFVAFTFELMMAGTGTVLKILTSLFQNLYGANIVLAVFNLLPVPPLDGFKVFGSALPDRLYYHLMSYERYIGLAFLVIIIFARNALSTVLGWIIWPFNQVLFNPILSFFTWMWKLLGLI